MMNIVFNCDENYAPYLATTISSIVRHSSKTVHFYVLSLGISEESQQCITQFVTQKGHHISFIPFDESKLTNFTQTIPYISKSTYARLFLKEYLPENIDNVLYLDCDTIVKADLAPLFKTDLQGKTLGAVIDPFIELQTHNYKKSIGILAGGGYFNAGMLLIDIQKFRAINVAEKTATFLQHYPDYQYGDQDILNYLFQNDVTYLDMRYNFQTSSYNLLAEKEKSVPYLFSLPIAILHDTGPQKAWHKKCYSLSKIYFHQAFNAIPNKPKSWLGKVENFSFLEKLKLIKKKITRYCRYRIY